MDLPAHVGAGQEHEAAFVVEAVWLAVKWRNLLLDDRMAAVFDMDDGVVCELRTNEAAFGRNRGKRRKYVKGGRGFGCF